MVLQGIFVVSDKVFGCDNPTYNPSPVRELNLLTQFSGITTLQSLVLRSNARGLDQAWSCLWEATTSYITPVLPTLNCGKTECNTRVRLQSRVTSSGATVKSGWFFLLLLILFLFCFIYLFIYLFIYYFLSFTCLFCLFLFCGCWFCSYFLLTYFFVCVCVLLSWFLFFFPSLFILRAVFISMQVGLGLIFRWLEIKIWNWL